MFKRLHEAAATVRVHIDDEPYDVPEGESVAAAILNAGLVPYRWSVVSESPRAPYCMIGNCFECLVEIDGQPNCQGCLVPVREGMRIRRQRGAIEVDV